MSVENLSLNENSAYVGASVTFRGDLIASDTVIVEGTVEGNVTAGSVFVGTNGAIKGSLSAADAEIKGLLSESAVIKRSCISARPAGSQDQLRRSRG
jgi:cytoskeletal protein CcmA (bactofilin family)